MSDALIRNCDFNFKCIQKWEELIETEHEQINFCVQCQKEVHLCLNDDALYEAMQKNWCVTIFKEDEGSGLNRLTGEVYPNYIIEIK